MSESDAIVDAIARYLREGRSEGDSGRRSIRLLDGDENEGSASFMGMFLWSMVKNRFRGNKTHTATLRPALPFGLGGSWMALPRADQLWFTDSKAQAVSANFMRHALLP